MWCLRIQIKFTAAKPPLYAMEPSPEQRGYWTDIHSNYKSTSCFLCSDCSQPSLSFFSLRLFLCFAHVWPAAKYFGSSEVNLLWINNQHCKGCTVFRDFEMFCQTRQKLKFFWHLSSIWLCLTAHIKATLSDETRTMLIFIILLTEMLELW